MLDPAALMQKYRGRGALVDANLLVLFLVGAVNRQRIPKFKCTQGFTIEDFDLLERLIGWFGGLIATPHVLSQASDLADVGGKELVELRVVVEQVEELYDPSLGLVTHPTFERFGLADAGIATICSRGILVLSADVRLCLELQRRGGDSLNFNHVRQLDWN